MRVYDNGAFFSVSASAREVSNFAGHWPCFGSRRALWAQFDKRNGDLVDISGDSDSDGGGIAALLDDMKAYGIKRLKLTL